MCGCIGGIDNKKTCHLYRWHALYLSLILICWFLLFVSCNSRFALPAIAMRLPDEACSLFIIFPGKIFRRLMLVDLQHQRLETAFAGIFAIAARPFACIDKMLVKIPENALLGIAANPFRQKQRLGCLHKAGIGMIDAVCELPVLKGCAA